MDGWKLKRVLEKKTGTAYMLHQADSQYNPSKDDALMPLCADS
jgi:hypothetical protein